MRRRMLFAYRQVLARMRQGDLNRDIAGARLMGRGTLHTVRQVAPARGWLDSGRPPRPTTPNWRRSSVAIRSLLIS